jgi:molybdopterin molybdotransferase
MGFRELHSVKDAISLLKKARDSLEVEKIDIDNSLNRIIAEDIISNEDVPPQNRSVLDGFAARWIDISGASESSPAILKVVANVPIDATTPGILHPGEAAKVATGSPIPEGADVVIPKEYVDVNGDIIKIYKPFAGGYGIALKGEDLRKGDIIIRKGDIIREWHLAILAMLGYRHVNVFKKLRAAVFATGNELVEPGSPKRPGQVYVSTARLVIAWLRNRGVEAKYFGITPDVKEKIKEMYEKLSEKYDIVISTGGTSVGEKDYTANALKEVSEDYIHGIALSPGKPAAFGIKGKTIIMALSGMPVAALSELIAVFDPYYRSLLGRTSPWEPTLRAKLGRKYTSHPGFTNVVRSILCQDKKSNLSVYPLRVTGSGILSTLIKANSYFIVDEETTGLDEGEEIVVRLISERIERCRM